MQIEEIEKLCEKRGLPYKGRFINGLTEEQFNAGCIKFNIPDEEHIESETGEGVWGWVDEENKKKYNDPKYYGEITAVLVNSPLNFMGILWWGSEVTLECHGENRPSVSPEWLRDKVFGADWYKKS